MSGIRKSKCGCTPSERIFSKAGFSIRKSMIALLRANDNNEEEAISFAHEYLKYREMKGGQTAPVSDTLSDPVRVFLEKALESRGAQTSA